MSNRVTLIISGIILMTFFLVGLLDIILGSHIMENLVTKTILIGSFMVFVLYIIKVNLDRNKKNLP